MSDNEMFPEQESLFSIEDRRKLDDIADQVTDKDIQAGQSLVRWARRDD